MDETSDGKRHYEGTFSFDSKSWFDHVRCILAQPTTLVATFAGIFGAFWTLFEATIASLALSPNRLWPYVAFTAISIVSASLTAWFKYTREIPEGLESTNKFARRLAHLRPPRWQFKFAKSLLAERLSPIDDECRDLLKGNLFVYAKPVSGIREYLSLMSEKPTNLKNLLGIVNKVIVIDFVSSLQSTSDTAACPRKILSEVETIARLYEETVNMERATRQITPPEPFEKLHQLQLGWAQPIRDGIQELFRFLQSVCDVDDNSELSFNIEFDTPENMELHHAEMERLTPMLGSIVQRYGE